MTAKDKVRPRPAKIDYSAAFGNLNQAATEQADNRFEIAAKVTQEMPSALSARTPTEVTSAAPAVQPLSAGAFDAATAKIGMVYEVPVALIDPNRVGPRHYYRSENVDAITVSMSEEGEQKVAANGFVKPDGRVELLEGGTRLRAAKAAGRATLQVKIEQAPKDLREQYKRAAAFHDERSDHTAIDTAKLLQKLLGEGAYASQDEIAGDLKVKGQPLSKTQVSMYLRIAKIPDRLLRLMAEHDATSSFTIAYEISAVAAQADYAERTEEYDLIIEDLVRQVQSKGLTKAQTQALVASKLTGPKSRMRGETHTVKLGERTGTLKVIEARGQLDFSIRGLRLDQIEHLKREIERACAGG